MRISDWSSDVCSSDLLAEVGIGDVGDQQGDHGRRPPRGGLGREVRGVAEAGCRLLDTLAVLRSHAAGGPVEHTRGGRERDARLPRDIVQGGGARKGAGFGRFGHDRESTAAGRCGETARSEEHTSELQSLMRISYAVFCLEKKKNKKNKL